MEPSDIAIQTDLCALFIRIDLIYMTSTFTRLPLQPTESLTMVPNEQVPAFLEEQTEYVVERGQISTGCLVYAVWSQWPGPLKPVRSYDYF